MLPVSSTLSVSLSSLQPLPCVKIDPFFFSCFFSFPFFSCLPFSLFLFLLFPFPVDSKAVLRLQIKVYLCLQLSALMILNAPKQEAHDKYINNTT